MVWYKQKRDQQTVPKMGPRISVTALPPPEGAAFASALQRPEFGAVRPPAELACAQGAEALLGSLRARARALQCVIVVGLALVRFRFPEQRVRQHRPSRGGQLRWPARDRGRSLNCDCFSAGGVGSCARFGVIWRCYTLARDSLL
jgi:hypothetical protein